jgi:hypothetical protein
VPGHTISLIFHFKKNITPENDITLPAQGVTSYNSSGIYMASLIRIRVKRLVSQKKRINSEMQVSRLENTQVSYVYFLM